MVRVHSRRRDRTRHRREALASSASYAARDTMRSVSPGGAAYGVGNIPQSARSYRRCKFWQDVTERSGENVKQAAEHPVRRFNDRGAGFEQQKGLACIEQRIEDVLIVRVRDLLRLLIQLLAAGRHREEPTVLRSR